MATDPGIEWRDYPRIEPGIYPAYSRWAKRYRDKGFHRWTCLVRFDVLSNDLLRVIARVPWWLNLGNGENAFASRRSNYFKEWIRANGVAPKRSDRLSHRVFLRRMARVEIGDTKSDAPYSVVRKIIAWETGAVPSGHSVNKSHSQGGQPSSLQNQRFIKNE